MNKRQDDVIILGGGIIGLFAADALSKAGLRVRILERNHRVGMESSWAGAGVLSPLHPWRYPAAISPLVELSQSLYPDIVERLKTNTGIDPEWDRCGMVILEPADVDAAYRSWLNEARPERLNAADDRLRGIAECRRPSAIFLPNVASVRNPRLLRALELSLRSRGVQIDTSVTARAVSETDNATVEVRTDAARFAAGQVVVACGAWSNAIEGLDGIGPFIEPVKGQMLMYRTVSEAPDSVLISDQIYTVRRRDGRLIVGSTVEHCGFDSRPTESAGETLRCDVIALLPELASSPIEAQWAGLRPGVNGGVPLIGRYPGRDNIFLSAGHYRTGLTTAPASAMLLAELMGASGRDEMEIDWDSASYDPSERLPRGGSLLPAVGDGRGARL